MPLNSQGISLKVSEPDNTTRNETINDVIGNLNDSSRAVTIAGRLFDAWEEHHYPQLVYPTLAAGALITSHNDAWTLGNFAEIIPANIITTAFHIHHLCVCTASANGEYELRLYAGTIEIGRMSFSRTDKKDDIEGIPIFVPHSVANSRIQAKLASENAAQQDTVRVKVWYHIHV